MMNGYRFRLYPTAEQQHSLLRWIGCQRLIYNATVQEDRYYRRFQRRRVGTAGMGVPIDQQYSRFITDQTAFLRDVPAQVLRNGAVRWRHAYQRFFRKLGGRPQLKKQSGRQSVWLTSELFHCISLTDAATGEVPGYQLYVGRDTVPVGITPYVAHRRHAVPSSLYIAVEGGQWWLSLAAEDPTVTIPGKDADAATERIAEDLRHRSADQLAARTLGGDRGVAKPLMTSEGQGVDLQPVQKSRIEHRRRQRQKWQRRAARRKKGSKNRRKAQQKAARYYRYEKNVRHEYAHQTRHRLVSHDGSDLYVFEDLQIRNMTQRPKAQRDAQGRFRPNGRQAKAGLNRAILSSAWGEVVAFTRYKALRQGTLGLTVPPHHSSQECAVGGHINPDNRLTQAEFVCQDCGQTDPADHNAAVVIAKRGIKKILSGDPLTKLHKTPRIFRPRGPERSKVTPGEISVRRLGPTVPAQRSMSQERPGAIPDSPPQPVRVRRRESS